MKPLMIAGFVLALAPVSARAQDAPLDTLSLARQYTMWLYEGQADSLFAHTAEASRGQMTVEQYARGAEMIMNRAGFEVSVVEETWKLRNGRCQYFRAAQFTDLDEPLLVRWVLNERGEIDGAGLGPLSQAPSFEQEHC